MFKSLNLATKFFILLVTLLVTYYGLNSEVDKFEKYDTVFACDFVEQFVEIYQMDKLCNGAFADGVISKSEFWSVTWRFDSIVRIWESNRAKGKGNPAMKVNADPPIKRRILPLKNSLEMPGLKELLEKSEKKDEKTE